MRTAMQAPAEGTNSLIAVLLVQIANIISAIFGWIKLEQAVDALIIALIGTIVAHYGTKLLKMADNYYKNSKKDEPKA